MPAGRMDRRIVIQAKSITEDGFGGVVDGWTDLTAIWAEYQPGTGGERRVAAAQEQAQMPAVFNVRWSDVTKAIRPQTHRISFEGSTWDIESITEATRRKGLSIVARRVL